jgi:hypothetical protein
MGFGGIAGKKAWAADIGVPRKVRHDDVIAWE